MIAVDTNLLVYAHRPEMPFHECAREALTAAVGGTEDGCDQIAGAGDDLHNPPRLHLGPKAPSLIRLKRSQVGSSHP